MENKKRYRGSNWIRKEKRLAIYMRDGMKCVYCGTSYERTLLTLDHIRPFKDGGSNSERNLITCCLSCNSKKGNLKMLIFLKKETKNPWLSLKKISSLRNKSIKRLKFEAKEILNG